MNPKIQNLLFNIEKVIIGKSGVIQRVIAALLCGGHVLIEDVPGTGKTRLAAALSGSVGGVFNRIQLTPDVLPQDITGFNMLNPETKQFEFKHGAAYCNFLLADEINRASPKVQSGLLEIMDERQISVDGHTYAVPAPFMTLATCNPIETFGTYHLPEAQMDRFLVRLTLGYLTHEEEIQLLDNQYHENKKISPVITAKDCLELQEDAKKTFCHLTIRSYILNIVNATRNNEAIALGVSPRGSMGLYAFAKASAYINGREYVVPNDVTDNAVSVLAHRIILSPKGRGFYGNQQTAIEDILSKISLPQGEWRELA